MGLTKIAQEAYELWKAEEYVAAFPLVRQAAAEEGFPPMMLILGDMLYYGQGCEIDYEEAYAWYQKAAEHEMASAYNRIGDMYFKGRGVPKDRAEGFNYYKKGAEMGCSMAQYSLGECYLTGEGTIQDFHQAAVWFQKSADQDDLQAQHELGILYIKGNGVPKNLEMGLKWLRRAAEQDNSDAQIDLAWELVKASEDDKASINQVKQEVLDNLTRAAVEHEHELAHYYLGVLHILGDFVEQDDNKAYQYFQFAAENGVEEAEDELKLFGRNIFGNYVYKGER